MPERWVAGVRRHTVPQGVLLRLRWAARDRGRPQTAIGRARLAWHDFIVHAIFGRGGERCQDCGHGYESWSAPAELWLDVHGSTGGLLCPACFARQARERGIPVCFEARRCTVTEGCECYG